MKFQRENVQFQRENRSAPKEKIVQIQRENEVSERKFFRSKEKINWFQRRKNQCKLKN